MRWTTIPFSLAIAACASAAGYPQDSSLSLDSELTLAPSTQPATAPASESVLDLPVPTPNPVLLDLRRAPAPPDSVTDVKGVDLADLQNDVYALAYRNRRGLGLGLASTGGVAVTGGYATEGGMQVNLYYIHSVPNLTNSAARAAGVDTTNLPARSVGLTIGWKF